ncbi:MAG: site-2 protease family protein, partial [Thermoguttaceae bacterium]
MQIAWTVLLVLIGVNALIIVHELGHFLVARMCGVRCDKFYIWFDIYGLRFFRFKWGQTEYGLGILPLGGYVKMFGQEDNPGQIAKEIEKAKLAASGANAEEAVAKTAESTAASEKDAQNAEPVRTPEEIAAMENALYAKDSYLSKSVPQRMAIISAGVIMNIIFAFVCATAAYMLGVEEMPCVVGGVAPGSPAWTAGLEVGDRIIEANNGTKITTFDQLPNLLIDDRENKGVKLLIEDPTTSSDEKKTFERV